MSLGAQGQLTALGHVKVPMSHLQLLMTKLVKLLRRRKFSLESVAPVGRVSPSAAKVYVHNYDDAVSQCVMDPKNKHAWRPLLTHSWAFKWLKQHLADELTMHVLHAFGVVRWRT